MIRTALDPLLQIKRRRPAAAELKIGLTEFRSDENFPSTRARQAFSCSADRLDAPPDSARCIGAVLPNSIGTLPPTADQLKSTPKMIQGLAEIRRSLDPLKLSFLSE